MPRSFAKTAGRPKPARRRIISDIVEATPENEKEFLALARQRFKMAVDAENFERRERLDDLKFATGDQWPQETKRIRDATNRPCMTINRYPAVKGQIVNEQRTQRPQMIVKPVGSGADQDDADMLEGLLRHIQVASDAEIAFDTAFEHMVLGGKGYTEISRDYLPGKTFDQELTINRVKNPFTIYCSPSSILPDESDANWKFKICDYDPAEYRAEFSNSELASASDFQSIGDNFPNWGVNKTIRVAEYWYKDWTETELYKMADGSVMTAEEYSLRNAGRLPAERPEPIEKRKWRTAKIRCALINAVEILDKDPKGLYSYTFPGKVGFIPLVPLIGEDFDVNGERKIYGIVRNSKDSQRAINYFRSYAAEIIALAPKAPWVGWKGQFKDAKWKTANVINYAYLEADVVTTSGQPAPSLPQRNQFEPPIQAIMGMSMAVDQDFKATTGIYEPGLGQARIDQSGKAIERLQSQSNLTNLNYTDNLSRHLRAVARVCLDAAPYVYDSPRIQRIINPDGSATHVIVHSGRANAAQDLKTPEIQDIYDLSKGVYDVVVDVGPSYKTRREEAFAMQLQLAEADKTGKVFNTCCDIIVANSNMPGAREMAARLKLTLPPNLLTAEAQGDTQVALAQATSTLRQLEAQNQELMKQNASLIQTVKEDLISTQKDVLVARIKAAASVEVAGIAAKVDAMRLDLEKFMGIHDSAHDAGMAAAQREHEKTLAAMPPPGGSNGSLGSNGSGNVQP